MILILQYYDDSIVERIYLILMTPNDLKNIFVLTKIQFLYSVPLFKVVKRFMITSRLKHHLTFAMLFYV